MIELPIWVFLTGLAGLLTIFGGAIWRLRGVMADVAAIVATLRAEQARLDGEHHAHEDICAHRYSAIEAQARALERRLDERHEASEKANDARHSENLGRFRDIAVRLDRLLGAGA